MIDKDLIKVLLPKNPDAALWLDPVNRVLPQYKIDTELRIAAFFAQCGHESNSFQALTENLNYSASSLYRVFRKYFKTEEEALAYEKQPERIANRVYADRMGNGPEESGDGWRYRGRGCIQCTGKNNYFTFAQEMLDDPLYVISHPDNVAADKEIALKSAVWYWQKNNLNRFADSGEFLKLSKAINIGNPNSDATPHGLEDRQNRYYNAMKVLK